ncbi:DUF3372 domain-containing protein [Psychrosphaera sp. B3R10]|uniref:alpha-1,6-glucosidase domain-containing protein n=1 Tax=unclassified Psychrosphaera TaxID=2641570 RepID=UPI001C0A6157|nr:DUF3372 domain-containing protein [Psychrosphaera sp. I2R16]MBU2989780.1 DUF3372 domain-containing protein [Psychrosphaera sp. B3R10]
MSNEEGLKSEFQATLQTPLTCRFPDTIAADSFGEPILDENANTSCERVELACENALYDHDSHSCLPLARHPLAPLEVAEAIPEDGNWATVFYWRDEFANVDPQTLLSPPDNENKWVIHAWNNDVCNAWDPDYQQPGNSNNYQEVEKIYWTTSWTGGLLPDGFDENYGLFWKFKLLPLDDVNEEGVPRRTDCVHYIVHDINNDIRGHIDDLRGDVGNNPTASLYNPDNMNYIHNELSTPITGSSINPYYVPPGELATSVRRVDPKWYAHWIDTSTILLGDSGLENSFGPMTQSVKLFYGPGDIRFFPGDGYRGVDFIEFTRQGDSSLLTPEQAASSLAAASNFSVFTTDTDITPELAKTILQGTITVVAENADQEMIAATGVQTAKIIDALYTQGNNDANEATLGVIYEDGKVKNALWAPTAQSVIINIYNDVFVDGDYELFKSQEMTFDILTGIWSFEASAADVDQKLFQYEVSVFHSETGKFESLDVVDPYSVNLTTNTEYSKYVNLDDANLLPSGWTQNTAVNMVNPEDYVFYTGHVRDFSILDESTTPAHRGKFLAFTDSTSSPVQHLQSLADAGITHVQLMPINNIANIDDRAESSVNLGNTVSKLCGKKPGAEVCLDIGENSTETLGDILAGLDSTSDKSRDLLSELVNIDSYDFGYNSNLFTAPEGIYATNSADSSRIIELREMVQALHDMGLKVSLDFDFSHTNDSGLLDDSILDQVVPGYYHRRDPQTGRILDVTSAEDTASEHAMMTKLIADTLVTYSKHFNIDAFHLTAIDLIPSDSLLAIRNAVKAVNDNTYIYGSANNIALSTFTAANATTLTNTEVGLVNANMQDAVTSAVLFNQSQFIDEIDKLRISMVGNIANYRLENKMGNINQAKDLYTNSLVQDPAEIVNTIATVNSETLFDALQYNLAGDFLPDERIRAHQISMAIPLLSQGIPSLQMGSDLLRSKSMSTLSNTGGDWINRVDFTQQSNNWNVALPIMLSDEVKAKSLLMDSNIQVYSDNINSSAELVKEFLQIRKSSPLFRLTTADDIIDRVGFHNTGQNALHNLIAMSIDDGKGCVVSKLNYEGLCDDDEQRVDLDPSVDAIFVVINGGLNQQTLSLDIVGEFELHSIQQSSHDAATQKAFYQTTSFGGQLVVPALTTAVFIKPQVVEQGTGYSAFASVGLPSVTPYNNHTIYLHNDANESNDLPVFEYMGDGIYELTVTLNVGAHNFTIGDYDLSEFNVGGDIIIELDTGIVIGQSAITNTINITAAGRYTFSLNALDPKMPTLTVTGGSTQPSYGETELLIRGDFNGWSEDNPMIYVGNNTYVGTVDITATGNFYYKFANAAWDFRIGNEFQTTLNESINMSILTDSYDPAPTLQIDDIGLYFFVINANNPAAPIVTISKEVPTYAGEILYVRGFDSIWDTSRPMTYYGAGYYALDILAVQNEDLTFDKFFKIAAESWSNPNSGGAQVTLNGGFVATQTVDDAITLALDEETQLRIIYHAIDDVNNLGEIAVQALAVNE